jgi:phospholipase/lecithinase/hemolysin
MSQASALPTYSALYAFGDSLSDSGNVSIVTRLTGTTPVSPPYFQETYGAITGNVFSNGPTWVQDLSIALGLGTLAPSLAGGKDFAYGSAQTGPTPQNGSDPQTLALSLPAQIAQFKAAVPTPAAGALYTLSIGANDVRSILSKTGLTAQQQAADVTAAVTNEVAFIKQLAGVGAKHLLVLDVPDLGKVPEVTQGLINGTNTPSAALTAEATQLSAEYNTELTSQLAGVTSADGLDLHVVDAYTLIDNAVADPAAYGFANVTAPVWSGNYTQSGSGTLATTDPTTQNQYLFWDHLHPTETGQLAITALAEDQLGSMRFIDASVEAQAGRLYNAAFGRAPDESGLTYWSNSLHAGTALVDIAGGFLASAEFQARYNSPDNGAFVTDLYQNVLHRGPDAAGLAYWQGALDDGKASRAQLLVDFSESAENKAATPPSADAEQAARLYWAALDRAPDVTGLSFWTSQLSNGAASLVQEADALAASPEFIGHYGTLDNTAFVGQLYQNVLGRAGDQAGVAAWTSALDAGGSRGSVVTGFSESPEAQARYASVVGQDGILVT